MTPSLFFTASLLTTFFFSVALSLFLFWRMQSAPGAPQLAGFVAIVGFYSLGLVAPPHAGGILLALAPLGSAVWADFVIRLTGLGRRSLVFILAFGVAATLAQIAFGAGVFFETAEGLRGFRYKGAGLIGVAVALGLAIYGNFMLFVALRRAEGKRRREIAIVLFSSIVGLSTVVSFAAPLFGEFVAPWSVVALPAYPAILVYGLLRYELMAANVWARRAAGYALVLLLAAAVSGLLAAAPLSLLAPSTSFLSLWLLMAGAMVLAFALGEPIRRLADRLVYLDVEISAARIADWRAKLARADSPSEVLVVECSHLSGVKPHDPLRDGR